MQRLTLSTSAPAIATQTRKANTTATDSTRSATESTICIAIDSAPHLSALCDGGLEFRCRSRVRLDDFIHSRIELRDCERLLQKRHRHGIRPHRLVVLDTAPLSVHRDLCSIETAMQAR